MSTAVAIWLVVAILVVAYVFKRRSRLRKEDREHV